MFCMLPTCMLPQVLRDVLREQIDHIGDNDLRQQPNLPQPAPHPSLRPSLLWPPLCLCLCLSY